MINNELKKKFLEADLLIKNSEVILLAGHENPDGDSLGSLLAIYNTIKESLSNVDVTPFLQETVPGSLDFLPGVESLRNKVSWYPDLVIGFDYGDFARLNLPEEMIQGARILTFDHHPENKQRGDLKIIETSFSSTCELVYEFLKIIGHKISKATATCLFTGIVTDTGAFAHNTSKRTLRIVGEILDIGVPVKKIYKKSFSKSSKVLNIWGELLSGAVFNTAYNFNAICVPFEKFKKYGIMLDDLTGLIAALSNIKEAKFSILVVEYENGKIKGSIRSDQFKGIDVSRIAKALGGGGHKFASGFNLNCSLEEAKHRILEVIKENL